MASSPPVAPRRTTRRGRIAGDPVVWGALLLAVAMFAVGLLVVLSHSEPRRAGTNGVVTSVSEALPRGAEVCQPGLILPAGAGSVQLSLLPGDSGFGPQLAVSVRGAGRTLARGRVAAGWSTTPVATAIPSSAREIAGATVCVRAVDGDAGVAIGPTPVVQKVANIDGEDLGGTLRVDFVRERPESWWAFAPTVLDRIGIARGGWSGAVVGVVLLGCFALVLLLAAFVTRDALLSADAADDLDEVDEVDEQAAATPAGRGPIRSLTRRLPAVAWAVLALGALNAATWSVITPPFYGPDEMTHFAYAQTIAETGRPPIETADPSYSPELVATMADVHADETIPEIRATMWTQAELRRLQRDERASLPKIGDGSAKASNPEPPLYYALAAIPYSVARSAPLLDRLALMRLMGALLAGLAALFVFLFARESLPGRPWAASVSGLVVAFVPMVGFVSGSVNPDALLFPVCAALFYCLARAFRRGMSTRLAIWIGVVLAVGLIGKINFYGLIPGALIACLFATLATTGADGRTKARWLGLLGLVGFAPFLLMHLLDATVWDRGNILWEDTSAAKADHGGLGGQIGFLWQVFFPPLPGQTAEFPGIYIGYELWFKTFVGGFSGQAIRFPAWVYQIALGTLVAAVGMALWSAARCRDALRRRLPELAGYLAMTLGLLLLIGLVALRGWAPAISAAAQGRYLLPLLALLAAVVTLALRGLGDRWGRAAGVVLIVLAIAWSLFGQLISIEFFYG